MGMGIGVIFQYPMVRVQVWVLIFKMGMSAGLTPPAPLPSLRGENTKTDMNETQAVINNFRIIRLLNLLAHTISSMDVVAPEHESLDSKHCLHQMQALMSSKGRFRNQ